MANDAKQPTMDQLIGANVRRLREAENATQDDYARRGRIFGLPWSQSTIAALEAGRKTLDLAEVTALMCAIPTTRDELFAGEWRLFRLTPGLAMPPDAVRGVWAAKSPSEVHAQTAEGRGVLYTVAGIEASGRVEERRRQQQRYDRILPRNTAEQFGAAMSAAQDEATRKAARKLGVEDPVELAFAALRAWGRSLTEEREARIAEAAPPNTSPRTLQALRGHVTRQLLEELEPIVRKAGQ